MVSNIVNAVYSETYDLNTAVGELSILGIHTPLAPSLKTMFKGFFSQYSKFKINGCSLQMVCASQQQLDPTQMGLTEGQVDPRDVLNPILFKACTGEKLNALLDQVYNSAQEINATVGGDNHGSGSISQHVDTRSEALEAYYSLLADESFRKTHPQSGLVVNGLRPMVHRVVTTQPFKWQGATGGSNYGVATVPRFNGARTSPADDTPVAGFGGDSANNDGVTEAVNPTVFVSNGICDMPWLDTTYAAVAANVAPGAPSPGYAYQQMSISDIPRVYMGVIVLPPAILQRLFFRMRIVWSVSFKGFRPYQDTLPVVSNGVQADAAEGPHGLEPYGRSSTYFNLYHNASALSKTASSFDANGVSEIESVMEQVK